MFSGFISIFFQLDIVFSPPFKSQLILKNLKKSKNKDKKTPQKKPKKQIMKQGQQLCSDRQAAR